MCTGFIRCAGCGVPMCGDGDQIEMCCPRCYLEGCEAKAKGDYYTASKPYTTKEVHFEFELGKGGDS